MSYKIIPVEPFDYFVFGATGDLAQRKLFPALYHRFVDGQIPNTARIIGCSRTDYTEDEFCQFIKETLNKFVSKDHVDAETIDEFLNLISYQAIDINNEKDFENLAKVAKKSDQDRIQVYYLSVGPSLFGPIIDGLKKNGLNKKSRLVVEKP